MPRNWHCDAGGRMTHFHLWHQSPQLAKMIEACGVNHFAIPTCSHCHTRFYPPQSWCPSCLDESVQYLPDDGSGTLVSSIRLHISFDAAWKIRLPVDVGCIRLRAGISVYALIDESSISIRPGDNVLVRAQPPSESFPALLRALKG